MIGYRPFTDSEGDDHYLPLHAEIPIGGRHILESVTETWEDSDGEEYSREFVLDSMTVDTMEDDGTTHVYVLREYYTTCIDGRERVAYSLAALDEKDRADVGAQSHRGELWVRVDHSVNREPSENAILRAIRESTEKRG